MFSFATDYYITVFVATLGVLQVAVSLGQLKGLLIFKSPLVARAFGLALPVGAFAWFFATGTRNVNDYEGGLDGNVQALFLFLGASTAVGVTLLVSSVVNAKMNGEDPQAEDGLDALMHTNYARALGHSFRYRWRVWRAQMSRFSSG